jgi:hypothetical protein
MVIVNDRRSAQYSSCSKGKKSRAGLIENEGDTTWHWKTY